MLVVDDHPLVCEALGYAIADEEDMVLCGSVGSASEALSMVETCRPDVMIVDLQIRDADGLDLVHNLLALSPGIGVLMFSMFDEQVYAPRAIQAGAKGYLMKSEPVDEVLSAIRRVYEGDIYLSVFMTGCILNRMVNGTNPSRNGSIESLTDRELAVVQMMGSGREVYEIMRRLKLSRKTIETYRRRAKEKLGFETLHELERFAMEWVLERGSANWASKRRREEV